MAERILEHFGLAPYFDAICGAPEGDKEAGKKANVVKPRSRRPAATIFPAPSWSVTASMTSSARTLRDST